MKCVFLSSKVGGKKNKPVQLQLQSLAFFEQDLFNQLLSPLFNKIPNKIPNKKGFSSFEQFDQCLARPVEILNDINSPQGLSKIAESQPDLIISIRYGCILKNAVIEIPPLGVLNLHSGILPDYRGVMATFWAMLNNEQTAGTTLHYISDASIDTGSIVASSALSVDNNEEGNAVTVNYRLNKPFFCRLQYNQVDFKGHREQYRASHKITFTSSFNGKCNFRRVTFFKSPAFPQRVKITREGPVSTLKAGL